MITEDRPSAQDPALRRRRVLVVEDEFFIADEIAQHLRDAGFEVVGPAPTLKSALQLAGADQLDMAVLDIDLRGEKVFPVAELLKRRGVPFIFASGYDAHTVPPHLAYAPCLDKPLDAERLAEALEQAG